MHKDAAGKVRTKRARPNDSKIVSFRLRKDERAELRRAASKAGKSVGEFVRAAIYRLMEAE